MAVPIKDAANAVPGYPARAFGASAPAAYANPQQPASSPAAYANPQQPAAERPVTAPLSEQQIKRLTDQGFSRGLAQSLNDAKKSFSKRIWIVDNSGSMQTCDGHRMAETRNRKTIKMIECSRWEEIQECVKYHTQLSGLLEAPTSFRLLNDPGAAVGPQQFHVATGSVESIPGDVQNGLRIMQRARPGGCTPLTQHILEIHREVSAMAPTLRANGQRVTIQIATDGLPSDLRGYSRQEHRDEFVEALRSLEGLPVWVVVRLCTDEEDVVNFYNELDSVLELSMEVLDDFVGEAEEVHEHNPWLNYALPIHRMREMGYHDRVFDMLDERKLTKSELRDFCYLLFGEGSMDGVADPNVEWHEFCKDMDRLLRKEEQQWDPIKKRMKPWVDLHTLNYMYGDGSACAIL
ncbi:expressed unknown protein [Seminavis robusta]|uniref:Uncharacterized protein n=1 Tax=Seminavis robusta TaxID=568900 RepID=A0A9N8DRX9_9STRA|nr:expressed unknown protein [Seminavis robusta]|eukprot:Sro309_g113870.1 n/a (406) ;mRNA; r:51013-52230